MRNKIIQSIFCSCFFFLSFSILAHAEEETPVTHEKLAGLNEHTESRSWRAPSYDYGIKPLGYTNDSFSVPKGFEDRVEFWKKIYTQYSSSQGVIHDSEDVKRIYKVVDFSDLNENTDLLPRKRDKSKQKRVEEFKKQIVFENPGLKISDLRFQLGQKDRIQEAIFISGRYMKDFEEVFRQYNLPLELIRLVFVESSFNVLARSKVGASGLWQIMPSNAKPYRMISSTVDKRNHPLEATKLAAKIFKNNYNMLGDWSLAVTGYNHGPTGVLKMTQKYKTRSLSELVDNVNSRKSFGFASKNFYASFLAILEVEKNADQYFKGIKWSKRLDAENLKMKHSVKYQTLLKWFDNNNSKLQLYNPHLTRNVIVKKMEIPSGTWLMVPEKNYLRALADVASIKRSISSTDALNEKWRVSLREREKRSSKTKN
ncbi:MAG: lytic transglycosylase domain-containing protein [Bdellovibrionaceae bacterium]|nr:lytic transglycosylase domain-containing protein [Pseudobdellovibrionaceae bacterium]